MQILENEFKLIPASKIRIIEEIATGQTYQVPGFSANNLFLRRTPLFSGDETKIFRTPYSDLIEGFADGRIKIIGFTSGDVKGLANELRLVMVECERLEERATAKAEKQTAINEITASAKTEKDEIQKGVEEKIKVEFAEKLRQAKEIVKLKKEKQNIEKAMQLQKKYNLTEENILGSTDVEFLNN